MSDTKTKTETKTEMPNPFAAFDPMMFWTASQQNFQKLITDAYGRAQAFADQYAALESQFVSRAQTAVANWAQLTQEAIAYSAQLSAEARKIGFETARRFSAGA
jgi:hypothetical protein